MLERVRDTPGIILSLDEYWPDFELNRSRVTDRIDKLERRQYFEEPSDPGWQAFVSGDWQEALRLEELNRQAPSRIIELMQKRALSGVASA